MADVTILEHVQYLLPGIGQESCIPPWPPDVFAICASLLVRAGAYCDVLTNWPQPPSSAGDVRWDDWAWQTGKTWRYAAASREETPADIQELWNEFMTLSHLGVRDVSVSTRPWVIALQLMVLADEASEGVGSALAGYEEEEDQAFLIETVDLLAPVNARGSTLGKEVDALRMRILPKVRTPQSGLTIRSLSHNLCIVPPDDIVPEWFLSFNRLGSEKELRLLLIPFPFKVDSSQFVPTFSSSEMSNMPDCFGFFTFEHKESRLRWAVDVVKQLHSEAQRKVGRIDGIILPEASVDKETCEALSHWVKEHNANNNDLLLLIVGYGEKASGGLPGTNRVHMRFPDIDVVEQGKHHRWKIDRNQIEQYGIRTLSNLRAAGRPSGIDKDRSIEWWEFVPLTDRRLKFHTIDANITLSVLICEDLARPDPVGDLLRAVGPNLVVALLMDGPQFGFRWSARYANALADDPGCSVLSVTSLGMTNLSTPKGMPSSRVIALWKHSGSASLEISLEPASHAVVLKIKKVETEEWTADGRSDGGSAKQLRLDEHSITQISLPLDWIEHSCFQEA